MLLRSSGFDCASIQDDQIGSVDVDVLHRAAVEGRVVLTFDRDFGELVFRRQAPIPSGIIFVRYRPAYPEEPGESVLLLVSSLAVEGRFTTISRRRVRQRPLLTES
jgi:hypothetical protein